MKKYSSFGYLFFFFLILGFAFKDLILNISTNLMDWNDYPFVVWVISHNIDSIKALNFSHFFDGNIFYPFANTLLLSDLFIPQSIIGLLFSYFTKNIILTFNLIFVSTFTLNYLSSFILWKKITNSNYLSFIGGVLTTFSPFYFLEWSHFQMLSYWPFLFGLYFLIKSETKITYRGALVGLFCTVQFLASAYLGVFFIFTIVLHSILNMINKRNIPETLKTVTISLLVFFMTSGVFILGYVQVKKDYSIKRNLEEYIQYSVSVTDYVFSGPLRSVIHKKIPIINRWNTFDKNSITAKATFPGFILSIPVLLYLIKINTSKKRIDLAISIEKGEDLFFALLGFCGLIFSWGPRISFNGNYAHIPSLYTIFLKYVPLLDSVRAPARWSFLLYISLVYFLLKYLLRFLNVKRKALLAVIFTVFVLLEYLPIGMTTHSESFTDEKYITLASACLDNPKVLLEVPITHFDGNGNILSGLNRVTKYELSSTIHKCNLVNGYSGYDVPSLQKFKNSFYITLADNKTRDLYNLLVNNKIDFLKVNKNSLSEVDLANYNQMHNLLLKDSRFVEIQEDLFEIKYQ